MKPSEFYEKHWKINYGKGLQSPPKLKDIEKEFLDYSIENTNNIQMIL